MALNVLPRRVQPFFNSVRKMIKNCNIFCSSSVAKMATPLDERMKRLEARSREADNALKQLKAYTDVLKQVEENSTQKPAAVLELERENAELLKEIQRLKQKLIDSEILNGRPHVVNPIQITAPIKPKVKQEVTTSNGAPSNEDKVKTKPKKEKAPPTTAATGGGASDKSVDVSRLDFRIGQIVTVKQHPDADTLYVEEIELGEERPRTVCSGLVKFIPIEKMKDRLVVVLCNLKPAKMRGILSEAMVMCASSPDKVELLDPPQGSVPGDRVTFEGYTGQPDAQLNPKKKIFEQIQPDLMTTSDCIAVYKDIPFTVSGKGICRSQTLCNTIIK